jgi:hypothetical protein
MQETHIFNTEVAQEVGIEAAILFQNISFWIDKNEKNDRHKHEGRYWTYNSTKAFAEQFPYMTDGKIRRALEKLVAKEWIIVGNFNKLAYDRTRWFAVAKPTPSICQNQQMDLADTTNGFGTGAQPIPDINTDVTTDDNTLCESGSSFELFWKTYPKKVGKKMTKKAWVKLKPDESLVKTIIAAIATQRSSKSWKQDNGQFIPNPATYLNGERWNDEINTKPKHEATDGTVAEFLDGLAAQKESGLPDDGLPGKLADPGEIII